MRLIDANELSLGKFVEPRTDWHRGWNDALDAATTQAPTVAGWIPVTERLPESGEFIVVANWDKNHTPRVVKANVLMVQEFWGIATGFYAHGQQVTHWMPLPEPPKEVHHG